MEPFSELKRFVLDELKKLYPMTSITLWFEPMEILELTDTEVLVQFPDTRKKFVEANYLSSLQDTFSAVMGAPVTLKLTTPEEQNTKEQPQEEPPKELNAYLTRFNPNYTFENFIVGKSNQLAQTAALAVAKQPFDLNNPLYLYGPSGLGKTHLLFAIINHLRVVHPEFKMLYVTGEEFTNELIEALAQHKPVAFREKYRRLDVLLVDDIQFIAGKIAVQEEFFHTFEALFQNNKQLIIASDVPPDLIDNLEDRLKTRFAMGLVADIQPPDLELRTAIFRRKALDYGFDMDFSVLSYLATHITTNIRQIEGAIKKLRASCLLTGDKCTVQMAERTLAEFFRSKESEQNMIEKIFALTSKKYFVSKEDLVSTKRTATVTSARHFAIYLIRKKTSYSQKQIAKLFNKKDHTTVMNSINVVEDRIHTDTVFARDIALIMDQLDA